MKVAVWHTMFLLLLVGLIAACKNGEQPTLDMEATSTAQLAPTLVGTLTSTSTPDTSRYKEWVYDPACEMPCWGEIEVGRTTIAEAERFLQTLPLGDRYEYGAPRYIVWEGESSGSIHYWAEYMVSGSSSAPEGVLNLTFAEPLSISKLVSSYGNPTHVYFATAVRPDASGHFESPDDYSVEFIFLPSGLAVGMTIHKDDIYEGSIQEQFTDLESTSVRFFYPPSGEGYAAMLGGDNFDVAAWQEGANWTYYCEWRFETTGDPRELFFDCPD